ncbi:MAG: prephenate dehydrogenase [Anaerolineales bacterium]|nr:MAG: prephenate dehydrogenase [Anaerolineales bacterium]
MAIQITIVGLGQIGASIGLALAQHSEKFERVGHDRDIGIARKAQKLGAVDRVSLNLPSAVEKADIIILSVPTDQIQETLSLIALDMKQDAVLLDTAPVKEVVAAWVSELFPEKRHYVGLTPVINPAYLIGVNSGLDAARADLFHKGMLGIVTPPRTASEAIKLSADLTRLLGAEPFFIDPSEMDGLMAATHTLPELLSAALLNATIDQPGWREGRKVAGRIYAEMTSPSMHISDPLALSQAALLNRENVVRRIDGLVAALQAIRNDIESEDSVALEARLERARDGRVLWWQQRQAANWATEEISNTAAEIPTGSEIFGRLLGIGRKRKPKPGK